MIEEPICVGCVGFDIEDLFDPYGQIRKVVLTEYFLKEKKLFDFGRSNEALRKHKKEG